MPHIKTGEMLHVGDKVIVEFVVKDIYQTDDYCNANLQFVEPFYPELNRFDHITVNAKMIAAVTDHSEEVSADLAAFGAPTNSEGEE